MQNRKAIYKFQNQKFKINFFMEEITMDNYTMRTFEKQFGVCYNQLCDLGYKTELNKKQYQLQFIDGLSTLGQCRNHGNNRYTIYLSKNHADISEEKYVINTVMHELIHSLDNCMAHTGRWKQIANIVNSRYGYNITRVETDNATYSKYYREVSINRMKYEIICNSCGSSTKYQRKTKTVTNIANHIGKYRCQNCGAINSFDCKELT